MHITFRAKAGARGLEEPFKRSFTKNLEINSARIVLYYYYYSLLGTCYALQRGVLLMPFHFLADYYYLGTYFVVP